MKYDGIPKIRAILGNYLYNYVVLCMYIIQVTLNKFNICIFTYIGIQYIR